MLNLKGSHHFILLSFLSLMIMGAFDVTVFADEKPLPTMTKLNAKIEYNKVYAENLNEMTLDLNDSDKQKLRDETPSAELDDTIKLTQEEVELKSALAFQKGRDIEDLKLLWDATIERNQIIRFTLEKLATPPQERYVKSSLMARSIATMLQGAAIVPSLFGMGMASEYGSAFGGQLVANAFQKKFVPERAMPALTEPELIQLTGLIEELQEQIINSYYNYKSSLESLILENNNSMLQASNYQKALDSKDITAIVIASALYDKSKQSELRLRQQVKLHRVELERLAGVDTVENLNLSLSENVIKAKYNFEKMKENTKDKVNKSLMESANLKDQKNKEALKQTEPDKLEPKTVEPNPSQEPETLQKDIEPAEVQQAGSVIDTKKQLEDLSNIINETEVKLKGLSKVISETEHEIQGEDTNEGQ